MYLLFIAIDAYSKWPEVFVANSTSAQQTIVKLRTIFATHELPATLVSNNGPPFTLTKFEKFIKIALSTAIVHHIIHHQMG